MASKPRDFLADDLPSDLACFVRRLRREQPEKYALGDDWDDPVLDDLDEIAAGSELGARLRDYIRYLEARADAEDDEEEDRWFAAMLLLENPRGNA
jgi:hypothetical protein